MSYAANTTVPVEKTRAEIEKVLHRYGARSFGYAAKEDGASIYFEAHQRRVVFKVTLPKRDDTRFTHYRRSSWGAMSRRSTDAAFKLWEQACRTKWRALLLVIKAKLEAVESGITSFEEEFLAQIMLPDGTTVAEAVKAPLNYAYEHGRMPNRLITAGGDPEEE